MMKRVICLGLLTVMSVAACQQENLEPVEDAVFSATIEEFDGLTKTSLNSSNSVVWTEYDEIAIFNGKTLPSRFRVLSSSAGSTVASFDEISANTSGNAISSNVALYPYDSSLECEFIQNSAQGNAYLIDNVLFPDEQSYQKETFANGSFIMAAVTKNLKDKNLTFRNVSGALRLRIKGDVTVKRITLKGNSGEILAGDASVTAYPDGTAPSVEMHKGGSQTVILNCGSGVALNNSSSVEFIIALPPTSFKNGFTVTITDTRGATSEHRTEKSNVVNRSRILNMPEITFGNPGSSAGGNDYVDEYGVNHGQGVEIDGVVWAPVNCGYHATDFKYGKLYQWGRKYGQGYSGNLYDLNGSNVGTYSDLTVPTVVSGPVDLATGQSKNNENIFYKATSSPYDWLHPQDSKLWNSGSESKPVKTEYDPCPDGWRVPTYDELNELCQNYSSWTSEEGQPGHWFSGASSYTKNVPQVFFPAAGRRDEDGGIPYYRGYDGNYWYSMPYSTYYAYFFWFDSSYVRMNTFGGRAWGYSVRCVQDDAELIPVSSLTLSKTSFSLDVAKTATLTATIVPSNANHQSAYWWSDNESVATVDQNGKVTAVSVGTATITAMAGMQMATCKVTVNSKWKNYVDEYGVNHGQGIEIDGVVWAPVNCGYHATDFKYGKLYQWGRKYGQGYNGPLYDLNGSNVGTYSDLTVPTVVSGPVDLATGQSQANEDNFYNKNSSPYDWLSPQNDELWNSGTEENPLKTEYDPCPAGWRVPTYAELNELCQNYSSWTSEEGQLGHWFSGASSYTKNVPQVFFPAAGRRRDLMGTARNRGEYGRYWSSRPYYGDDAYGLFFDSSYVYMDYNGRATGYSVRCVQD